MFDFGASHNGPVRGGQPTRGVCSAAKGVFSEMNKCLTLVHLITEPLRGGQPDTRRFLSAAQVRL